jgi:acetyl/propionyl-CoA carboxylase alpha subunit
MKLRRVLVANRAEIAIRVFRACREAGIETVAIYSDADADAAHVAAADRAVRVGPPPPRQSYLNIEANLAAARQTKTDAIHPGYGFLS